MSDDYTRTTEGDYQVTLRIKDQKQYEEFLKLCRQMREYPMPIEPMCELRPSATWIEDGHKKSLVCSNCGTPEPVADIIDIIRHKSIRYCYCCGAKMESEKEKNND